MYLRELSRSISMLYSSESLVEVFQCYILLSVDGLRPHSNSLSSTPGGTPVGSAEEQLTFTGRNGSLPKKTPSGK
jgi:hypothetical protein